MNATSTIETSIEPHAPHWLSRAAFPVLTALFFLTQVSLGFAVYRVALAEGLANTDTPTIIDVIVTRDPSKMLPAADNRAQLTVKKGDRPV